MNANECKRCGLTEETINNNNIDANDARSELMTKLAATIVTGRGHAGTLINASNEKRKRQQRKLNKMKEWCQERIFFFLTSSGILWIYAWVFFSETRISILYSMENEIINFNSYTETCLECERIPSHIYQLLIYDNEMHSIDIRQITSSSSQVFQYFFAFFISYCVCSNMPYLVFHIFFIFFFLYFRIFIVCCWNVCSYHTHFNSKTKSLTSQFMMT